LELGNWEIAFTTRFPNFPIQNFKILKSHAILKIKNLRWYIAGMIALATAINYLDRQSLPIILSELRKAIPVSDGQYGLINSVFLFSYGTMYAIGGRILDVMGSRKGYAIMIAWWSLASGLHGLIGSVLGLGIARFLLGLGEGGGFPGSAKVVSEWFPVKERSFAFGIFNTGASLGAVIAPPLFAAIITFFNWRWAFLLTGVLGLMWAQAWWKWYATPNTNKFITEPEKEYVTREQSTGPTTISWMSLFRIRAVWGLMTVKFLTDAGWFFFIFWLPKYLNDVRDLNIKAIGAYAWIPYAFAGAGSFLGGWFSSYLLKKNVSLDMARKIPMGISAALVPASLFITDASLSMAIVFFSLAMFGHQFWSTIVQTLAADLFPSNIVGTVAGLMGCIGTYGAMLFSLIIGFVIGQYGYHPAFLIAGVLHPVSFLLIYIIIGKIEMSKRISSIEHFKTTVLQ
jgi:ACS family hexuronate transporter-like MFS transporter